MMRTGSGTHDVCVRYRRKSWRIEAERCEKKEERRRRKMEMNPANGNRENENVAGYLACENRTEREWQNGEKFNTVRKIEYASSSLECGECDQVFYQ